ncbi:hypothetical protein B5X24_HaOG204292 [Helicoverpa armigera]|nr:hypothetical protein B5X24_HaOG204292 [Helicoverpa armigera]
MGKMAGRGKKMLFKFCVVELVVRLFGRHKPTEPAGAAAQQRSCQDQEHQRSNACAAIRSTGRAALVPQSAAPAQKRLGHNTAVTHSRV